MNFLKKITIQSVVIGIVLLLMVFGIYNNPDRKTGFTPQQEAYLKNLGGEFQGFLYQNEKVKIITLKVVNALGAADNRTINDKYQQLLPEIRLLQNQLVDVRYLIAEGKVIFFDQEKMRRIFEVLDEIYQFRYEYNGKVIEIAELGSIINFNNEQHLDVFYTLSYELDEMDGRLPELHKKLTDALSVVDSQLANYLAEYPFLWK